MSPSKKDDPPSDHEVAEIFFARQKREILDEIAALEDAPRVRFPRITAIAAILLITIMVGFSLFLPREPNESDLTAATWSDLPLFSALSLEEDPLAAFGQWSLTARSDDHSGLPPLALDSLVGDDESGYSADFMPLPLFQTPGSFGNESPDDQG